MSPLPIRISCREIDRDDIKIAISLLKQGFPNHALDFWPRMLARLTQHRGVTGMPKYGFLLEVNGRPVGVLLEIFSEMPFDSQMHVRANIGSWYVEPQFRNYATILTSRAHSYRGVTYLQLTPSPHVVPIVEAQGYRRYANGVFAAAALLCSPVSGVKVNMVPKDLSPGDDLSRAECDLLLDHQRYGCLSVTCTLEARRHPFVFARRRTRTRFGCLPNARLVYCRGFDDFARFAGPLGRFLALRGMPVVYIDSNGPLSGVPGRFIPGAAKFFKGPHAPHLGDLAYTEMALFGI